MRIILGRASLTLTMLLFAARTKRTMTLTWNTFLKLLNARTSVITLESVFSQPSVSLSSDTSLRRVLYGQILIVYDPLSALPIPHNSRSMSRCLGLFSYYSQWIPRFSDRIKPIPSCKSLPLPPPAVEAFESLKKTIEHAAVTTIDETIPFEVETDASEVALAATLNQNGRPVSFFSRTI